MEKSHIFGDTLPVKQEGTPLLKKSFDFDNLLRILFWATKDENNGTREQRNARTMERGNNWNDTTTSALFKNLVFST
jgi:hypothetical protein